MLLFLLSISAFAQQIDAETQHFLDSLGIKYDPNDPDGEAKLEKAMREKFTGLMDSATKVASNTETDPFNTEGLKGNMIRELQEVDQYEQKLSSEGEKQSTNMMKNMQGGKTTMVPPPVNYNAAAPKARDFSQMTLDQARKMADSGEVNAMSVLDYKAFTKAMNKLLK